MNVREFYAEINGNFGDIYDCLGSDDMVKMFAMKFLNDESYKGLKDGIASGDIKASFRAAHTLKGVCANLGFSALANAASELTEQLRPLDSPADPGLVAKVDEQYELLMSKLKDLD